MDRSSFDPQVGDWVRIRSWEDMKAEFGADTGGNIACQFGFNTSMRNALEGREFQITAISDNKYMGHGSYWLISKDMLEPCEDEEVDTKEIDTFLSSFKIL